MKDTNDSDGDEWEYDFNEWETELAEGDEGEEIEQDSQSLANFRNTKIMPAISKEGQTERGTC